MRTGQDLNETVLTPSNVNSSTFGKLASYPLDGLTLASPLYVQNVNIPGQGVHNIVIVATEHDSVYAFDADGKSSTPLWHVNFTNPSAGVTTVPAADTGETGDIPNEIGITGTPVIDPATGTIYVVAATKEVSGGTTNYVQRLHALDLTTGAEKFGGPVVIQASVPGTGTGSSGGTLPFDPLHENQRTGLLLLNGVVYFGFSSHGDVEPFHGWVLGYNASTLKQVMVYNATPNGNDGGVWMDGDGIASDSTGSLYFISGDGQMDANTGGSDYGDSFIRLSTSGTVQDYFSPSVQSTLDAITSTWAPGASCSSRTRAERIPTRWSAQARTARSTSSTATTWANSTPARTRSSKSWSTFSRTIWARRAATSARPFTGTGTCTSLRLAAPAQAFKLTNGLLSTSPDVEASGDLQRPRRNDVDLRQRLQQRDPLDASDQWSRRSRRSSTPTTPRTCRRSSTTAARPALATRWTNGTSSACPIVANGKVFVTSNSQLTVYGLLPLTMAGSPGNPHRE